MCKPKWIDTNGGQEIANCNDIAIEGTKKKQSFEYKFLHIRMYLSALKFSALRRRHWQFLH